VTVVREALYRETPGFYHVNVDGREIPVAKRIGADRRSPEEAIATAHRIATARKAGA
jgi:hypothetical protein